MKTELPSFELNELQLFSKGYSQLPALRALFQAIPVIGSGIDVFFTAPYSAIAEKRIEEYLFNLQTRVVNCEEQFKNLTKLFPQEVIDTLIFSIEGSAKTRSKSKKMQFAEILANQAKRQDTWENVDIALKLTNELTDLHIEFLKVVATAPEISIPTNGATRISRLTPEKGSGTYLDCQAVSTSLPTIDNALLYQILCDLNSKGLIQDLNYKVLSGATLEYFIPNKTTFWFLNWITTNE